MRKAWVLWNYDRGSYESIVNMAITTSEKAKNEWLARDTNRQYSLEYGADDFEVNEVPDAR